MTDSVTDADLAGLPPAQVIEELSHQAIVDRKVAKFTQLWEAERAIDPTLPPVDTLLLHSDPARKLIEEAAFVETLLRARMNDAARSNLLFYNRGTDIDHLVIIHDVVRMVGETDAALKSRTILAVAGRSPAGPLERYEAIARSADVRVASARAYRIGRDPTIYVAIYSTDNNGVADDALLAAVSARLKARNVEPGNATVVTRGAVFGVVNVVADIWLLPDAPESLLAAPGPGIESPLAQGLRRAWAAETGAGFDFLPEWATARLMASGVRKVGVLTPAIVAEPFEALSIGTITLNNRGRSY